uniref:Uncharacterized protein n=1 Tax=Nitrosopumivirus cobalaminus TaxID=3158414 RepID=A0AAU7N609_9VIRU
MTMITLYNELKLNERIDRLPIFVKRFTIVSMLTANFPDEFEDILFGHSKDVPDGAVLDACIKRIESLLGERI